uniref:Reverse transcriptase domain-containing protein n=1 Tax=Clastoptera arizonana TaxID=38151 RepID=A0A1B6E1N0_9HEMI
MTSRHNHGNQGTSWVRVLQLNAQRSVAVSGMLRQKAHEEAIDVLCIQEPLCGFGRVQGFPISSRVITGSSGGESALGAAIIVLNEAIDVMVLHDLSDTHTVVAELSWGRHPSVYLVSMYCQFSHPITGYLTRLEAIVNALPNKRVIVCMDANAKSNLWHSGTTDGRGEALAELIFQMDLVVENVAGQPATYSHTSDTNIDVTLSTPSGSPLLSNWTVQVNWTTSDHRCITFDIGRCRQDSLAAPPSPYPRYNVRRADWEVFRTIVQEGMSSEIEGSAEDLADLTQATLTHACQRAMPTHRKHPRAVPWWTGEISEARRLAFTARKRLQRAKATDQPEQIIGAYRRIYQELRNNLTSLIRTSKRESWCRFVSEEGNKNPWGLVYKLSMGKFRKAPVFSSISSDGTVTRTWEESVTRILQALVPRDEPSTDTRSHELVRKMTRSYVSADIEPEFDLLDLEIAVEAAKLRRAPGVDGITTEVVREVYRVCGAELLHLFNACLTDGVFPNIWKLGDLKLIPKTDKPVSDARSYRPICLLPVLGKLFERLLCVRLRSRYRRMGLECDRQYGFKPERSAEEAMVHLLDVVQNKAHHYVAGIFVDFQGAFDTLWWPGILKRLIDMRCPGNLYRVVVSYLSNRKVVVRSGNHVKEWEATMGCPQGSVLGPIFWNMVMDEMLQSFREEGIECIAYADDLAIVVSGNSRLELETAAQDAMDALAGWARKLRLTISPTKTVGLMLKGKLSQSRYPTLRIEHQSIRWVRSFRYLGLILETGLGFSAQAHFIQSRLRRIVGHLYRICRTEWGLQRSTLRTLYAGTILPVVTYGAPAWFRRASMPRHRRLLDSAQRQYLLLVVRACRTVSTDALQVLAGCAPLDLEIVRAGFRYCAKHSISCDLLGISLYRVPTGVSLAEQIGITRRYIKEAELDLAMVWQRRWQETDRGRGTYLWFPVAGFSYRHTWFDPPYAATCFLTGHGFFHAKLHELGLTTTATCICGYEREDCLHVMMSCPAYAEYRAELEWQIGPINSDTLREIVASRAKFEYFIVFARHVLDLRRRLGRLMSAPANE